VHFPLFYFFGEDIAGGHTIAGEAIGDILAGGLASKGLRFLACVERAGVRMAGAAGMRHWRPSAKVNEHKEERSLERLEDMEVSRRKIRFGIFGEVSRSETHY
jgi:hypothetical protein